MKGLNEKKGFTLIELLAVIVVLAIIMVLAVTTVLPYMTRVRKIAFQNEANAAIESAQNAMSLIQVAAIGGSATNGFGEAGTDYYVKRDETNKKTTYCFTLKQLVDSGSLKSDAIGKDDSDYSGSVIVTAEDAKKTYTYHIEMKNASYYVSKDGTIEEADVTDVSDSTSVNEDCTGVAS